MNVNIDDSRVVNIEITDQDEPWAVSRKFQDDHRISDQMTGQLFLLLQSNYDREMENLKMLELEGRHTPVDSGLSSEQISPSSDQKH